MTSRDPSKWMLWYLNLNLKQDHKEVLGVADSDKDDCDFLELEQEAENPEEEYNSGWFCDGDIPYYIGKDRSEESLSTKFKN